MHNFEVLQLPFHLGCLDRLQIQHEEKKIIAGASSMMAVLASICGAFFSVTFKLPFHALPLLSPHPASFRSFTPWASSLNLELVDSLSYVMLDPWLRPFSRISIHGIGQVWLLPKQNFTEEQVAALAMLAGVPLALARNMPGAGRADLLIVSMLTPPWGRGFNPPSVHRVKNSGIYSSGLKLRTNFRKSFSKKVYEKPILRTNCSKIIFLILSIASPRVGSPPNVL